MQSRGKIIKLIITIIILRHNNCKKMINAVELSIFSPDICVPLDHLNSNIIRLYRSQLLK